MATELLNIDCMEYMKDCKDNQFDLAIVFVNKVCYIDRNNCKDNYETK